MAIYNELLVGRFNRFTQKLFSIKGPASLRTVSPELQLQMTFGNGNENRYLEGWNRFMTITSTAAVAAQFAAMRLRNPTGSNMIAVLERIVVWGALADQPILFIQGGLSDLGTLLGLTAMRMDPRGNPNPVLIGSKGNAASAGAGANFEVSYVANSMADLITSNGEVPILPGDSASVFSNTLNQALNFSWMWRERFLEESERA